MSTTASDYRYDRRAGRSDRRAANSVAAAAVTPIPVAVSDGMRVSWAGVWGGVLAAVGLLLLLAALGVAVGVTAADPANTDVATLGSAAGIWAGASLLLALFVGGLVSTRAGAIHDRATSFWEGFLVWVVSLLLVAYLASSGVTTLATGAMHLVGVDTAKANPAAVVEQIKSTVQGTGEGLQQRAAQAQPTAARAAWATFGALFLSLLASVAGSSVGRRRLPLLRR